MRRIGFSNDPLRGNARGMFRINRPNEVRLLDCTSGLVTEVATLSVDILLYRFDLNL
jgi:hypothetical protein